MNPWEGHIVATIIIFVTLRVELSSFKVVLRHVDISSYRPQIQAEGLSSMVELSVGTLTVYLTR